MKKLLITIVLFAFIGCYKDENPTPATKNDNTLLSGTKWFLLPLDYVDNEISSSGVKDGFYFHFINKNEIQISWILDSEILFMEQMDYELQNKILTITNGETKIWSKVEALSDMNLILNNYEELDLLTNKKTPILTDLDKFKRVN